MICWENIIHVILIWIKDLESILILKEKEKKKKIIFIWYDNKKQLWLKMAKTYDHVGT